MSDNKMYQDYLPASKQKDTLKRIEEQANSLENWRNTLSSHPTHVGLVVKNMLDKMKKPHSFEHKEIEDKERIVPDLESDPFRMRRLSSHLKNGVISPFEIMG